MHYSMMHWHGNQTCVIDTETTGLDAHFHEIMQICILPLTSSFEPRRDVMPFCIDLKIECIERIDPQALKVNKIDLHNLQMRGFDKEKAKDLLRTWIEKLGLPIFKDKTPCKIRPLGQNYAFDRDFIQRWLGCEMYNEFFDYHYTDTMIAANFINDRAAMHGEPAPYNKVSLVNLAKHHSVEYTNAHNALSDCMATAAVYREMTKQGLLG